MHNLRAISATDTNRVIRGSTLEEPVVDDGVGSRQAYTALKQVHGGLIAHATPRRYEIGVTIAGAGTRIDDHDFQGLELVTDAAQLRRDLLRSDDVAIRQVTEIELDARLEAPIKGHFID